MVTELEKVLGESLDHESVLSENLFQLRHQRVQIIMYQF